mmetsp:Transcript_42238/g.108769  ORF Transcript_42238/g.108769 Transcript_42238/m.108769 type:complete len:98 (+) Transcript_42238:924-1217(+)
MPSPVLLPLDYFAARLRRQGVEKDHSDSHTPTCYTPLTPLFFLPFFSPFSHSVFSCLFFLFYHIFIHTTSNTAHAYSLFPSLKKSSNASRSTTFQLG